MHFIPMSVTRAHPALAPDIRCPPEGPGLSRLTGRATRRPSKYITRHGIKGHDKLRKREQSIDHVTVYSSGETVLLWLATTEPSEEEEAVIPPLAESEELPSSMSSSLSSTNEFIGM